MTRSVVMFAVASAVALWAAGCGDDEVKTDAAPPAADAADNTGLDDAASVDAAPTTDAGPTIDSGPVPDAGPGPDAAPAAQFMITEILYDPTGTDDGNEWVEIKNVGGVMGNLGAYRMCGANFVYRTLAADIPVPAGGRIVVHWNTAGTDNTPPGHYYTGTGITAMGNATGALDKSMALYKPTGPFGVPASILSYVQWIDDGQAREGVAIGAGIWTATQTVPAVAEGSSICFDGGDPTKASGYSADATPTPLAANGTCD